LVATLLYILATIKTGREKSNHFTNSS